MPRPGGDAWMTIARDSGEIHYERTTRGAISFLNDLHKGRNAGPMWGWFIDLFAVACVLFAGTGLFLLKMHSSAAAGHVAVCRARCRDSARRHHSVRSLKRFRFMRSPLRSACFAPIAHALAFPWLGHGCGSRLCR